MKRAVIILAMAGIALAIGLLIGIPEVTNVRRKAIVGFCAMAGLLLAVEIMRRRRKKDEPR